MKTIGIVAVTAEGAADCYKTIVRLAGEKLGVNKHPEIVLVNPSFDTILAAQKRRDWQEVAAILADAARKAQAAGAELIAIPANSVQYAYKELAQRSTVPVLNLVEEVAEECERRGYKKVAVLGVGFTVVGGLYNAPLANKSIENVALTSQEANLIDKIIYDELVHGAVNAASTKKVLAICDRLKQSGCEALILACTELPLMLTSANTSLPIIDSTGLLAEAAVRDAL